MNALEHAEVATQSIRALNHVSQGPHGYEPTSDAVLGELNLITYGIRQAIEQAGRWLDTAHAGGRIAHDDGADVTARLNTVRRELNAAIGSSTVLAVHLDIARQVTEYLDGITPAGDTAPNQ